MKPTWLRVAAAPYAAAVLLAVPMPADAAKTKKEPPAQSAASGGTQTESLGTAGAWSAYAIRDKGGRICYLIGQPQKSDPAGAGRKAPIAMITHRPSEDIANVVSFVEGYPLKEGSEVALEVEDRKFDLFTKDDSAWARTAELDRAIVAAFIKGRNAVVKGVPEKGKPTTDTYSLSGFAKALALIDTACGVKRAETASAAAPAPPKETIRPKAKKAVQKKPVKKQVRPAKP